MIQKSISYEQLFEIWTHLSFEINIHILIMDILV